MPAPSPAFLETNPPPLTASDFPFAVTPLPAQNLVEAALVIPQFTFGQVPAPHENTHRYQD